MIATIISSVLLLFVVATMLYWYEQHLETVHQALEKKIDYIQYQIDDVLCDINKLANKLYFEDVWHDASEEPNMKDKDIQIMYLDKYSNYIHTGLLHSILEYYDDELSWNESVKKRGTVLWAYADDLLPKTK